MSNRKHVPDPYLASEMPKLFTNAIVLPTIISGHTYSGLGRAVAVKLGKRSGDGFRPDLVIIRDSYNENTKVLTIEIGLDRFTKDEEKTTIEFLKQHGFTVEETGVQSAWGNTIHLTATTTNPRGYFNERLDSLKPEYTAQLEANFASITAANAKRQELGSRLGKIAHHVILGEHNDGVVNLGIECTPSQCGHIFHKNLGLGDDRTTFDIDFFGDTLHLPLDKLGPILKGNLRDADNLLIEQLILPGLKKFSSLLSEFGIRNDYKEKDHRGDTLDDPWEILCDDDILRQEDKIQALEKHLGIASPANTAPIATIADADYLGKTKPILKASALRT